MESTSYIISARSLSQSPEAVRTEQEPHGHQQGPAPAPNIMSICLLLEKVKKNDGRSVMLGQLKSIKSILRPSLNLLKDYLQPFSIASFIYVIPVKD